MMILENSNFLKLIDLNVNILMFKRLAYINSEGHLPEWLSNNPPHLYVLEASNKAMKVTNSIEHAKSIIKQIENPPPEDWLSIVGLSKNKFIQQHIDLFSVVLFSSLDRSLLLANLLLDIGKTEKEVTYKKIIKSIEKVSPAIAGILGELYKATESLADYRNHFSHRGVNRNTGRFSSVYRVKLITQLFDVPMENVKLLDNEAGTELVEMLSKEVSDIEPIILRFLEAVAMYYVDGLNKAGGLEMPSEEELQRAQLVTEYFSGGAKPEFMM